MELGCNAKLQRAIKTARDRVKHYPLATAAILGASRHGQNSPLTRSSVTSGKKIKSKAELWSERNCYYPINETGHERKTHTNRGNLPCLA